MPLHAINTNQKLIGLVNRSAVSIHHFGNRALICPVAFILHERRPSWLIVGMRPRANRCHDVFRREPHVKSHRFKTHTEVKGWEKLMSVNRKRFRIEQALLGDAPIMMPAV